METEGRLTLSIADWLSRWIAYPLWDARDGGGRLREFRRLQSSQWQEAAAIEAYQRERLADMLRHACATVPFYRDKWPNGPGASARELLERFAELPVLTKSDVRQNQDALLSSRFDRNSLVAAKTGGSTGVSLNVRFDVECQKMRNAAAMMSDTWAGWKPGMQLASLWGSPPVPQTFKQKVRNALHDRVFFLDTMDMNETTMSAFAREIGRKRAGALFGHAHSLYLFARFIIDREIRLPSIESVVSTSMVLLPSQRKVIERALSVPVFDRYGCEEVGLIAAECEKHEGLHINAEHVVVEFVDEDGTPVNRGQPGQLLLTDLNNRGMPLIRYAVGDVAVKSQHACSCGRGYPLMSALEGRVADYLVKADGALVSGISLVEKTLTAIEGLEQLQIIQQELARFRLNVVIDGRAKQAVAQELEDVIRSVFGKDVVVNVQFQPTLDQQSSGKYRFAICELRDTNA